MATIGMEIALHIIVFSTPFTVSDWNGVFSAFISGAVDLMNGFTMQFHVLVSDTNEESSGLLERHLRRLGCKVSVVSSSEGAIEILSEDGTVDAVFAALTVREKGARTVARWVRENLPHIKFFVTTSWKGELERPLLQMDGIHDVIHSPFVFSDIRDKLINHFG